MSSLKKPVGIIERLTDVWQRLWDVKITGGTVTTDVTGQTIKTHLLDASTVEVSWADTIYQALRVNVVAGGVGGGIAQLQVRDTANIWTDIGYYTGNLFVPVDLQTDNIGLLKPGQTIVVTSTDLDIRQITETIPVNRTWTITETVPVSATNLDIRTITETIPVSAIDLDIRQITETIPVSRTWSITETIPIDIQIDSVGLLKPGQTISTDRTWTLTPSDTITVDNFPSEYPLPSAQVTDLKKLEEMGSITHFNVSATSTIVTTALRLKVIAWNFYNDADITSELRFATSSNVIAGIPGKGINAQERVGRACPTGDTGEALVVYISGTGNSKGWVCTQEVS